MAPIILGYWELRGLGQPIRLLLEYAGVEWENKLFKIGDAPTYDISEWLSVKETLSLDFPNLPYLIDGDVKLSQSTAIMRYIARKTKLDGATEAEKQRVDLIECEAADIRTAWATTCYNPQFETLKGPYLENFAVKLQKLSKFLGTRPYFAGDNVTYVDFIVYEILDQNKLLDPNCLKNFKNLEEFLQRIEGLERIAAFLKSSKFIKYPLFGKSASFGG